MPPITGGVAYRVLQNDYIGGIFENLDSGSVKILGQARIVYDDGDGEWVSFPQSVLAAGSGVGLKAEPRIKKDGWVVGLFVNQTGAVAASRSIYGRIYINRGEDLAIPNLAQTIAEGYVTNQGITLGQFQPMDFSATWVFQGTVAEDATGGTHITQLLITPGSGNELELIGGEIVVGASATAMTASCFVTDDATRTIASLLNPTAQTSTVSGQSFAIPQPSTLESNLVVAASSSAQGYVPVRISGAMQLILRVSTAAVSVTHTYSIACRLKSTSLPTATLSDNTGTPTLTTNTNKVF